MTMMGMWVVEVTLITSGASHTHTHVPPTTAAPTSLSARPSSPSPDASATRSSGVVFRNGQPPQLLYQTDDLTRSFRHFGYLRLGRLYVGRRGLHLGVPVGERVQRHAVFVDFGDAALTQGCPRG